MSTEESKQDPPRESGLGFSNLSMNEIAPATTTEASEAGKRTSRSWVLTIVVVAVAVALVWLFQHTTDRPPSAQAQQQVRDSVNAESYGKEGTVQEISFLSGSKVRVEFTATISTVDEQGRAQLRNATQGILKKLIEVMPDRDIFVTGFQGEEAVVQARYLHRSALVSASGERIPDISIQVKNDPEGGISGTMGSEKSEAGR